MRYQTVAAMVIGPVAIFVSLTAVALSNTSERKITTPVSSPAQREQKFEDRPGFRAGYEAQTGHAIDARQFAKAEFSNYAYGRTKAQIRAEFGSPAVVSDGSDSWIYTDMAVFDDAAGTRAQTVTLRFTGAPPPDDFVADVSF